MGYTVDFKSWDLNARSNEDADKAVAAVQAIHDRLGTDYYLQIEASHATEPDEIPFLDVTHCQGDHWHDDEMRELWWAMAPHMVTGSNIVLEGEDGETWRVVWYGGEVFEEWAERVVWGKPVAIPRPAPAKEEASA